MRAGVKAHAHRILGRIVRCILIRRACAIFWFDQCRQHSLAADIHASLQEALDYAAGKRTRAIVHEVTPHDTDAREARVKLGLSQREFAALIGTGVGTVRKWELGTRQPSGAARALIEVIKTEPKAVRRALAKRSAA